LKASNSFTYNGDYVFVERDTPPNMNREEGYGFVVGGCRENTRDPPTVNVHYEIDNDVHLHDPLRDVTIGDYGEIFSKVSRKGGSYFMTRSGFGG
jgi:hypothetical protein